MLQFEITPEADGVAVSSLTLQASGSGDDDADLVAVTVWADADGDGRVDSDDIVIGNGTFAADNASLVLSMDSPYEVQARTTASLLITYDLPPTADATTANARLLGDKEEAHLVRAGSPVGRIGFHVTGRFAAALALVVFLGLVASRRQRVRAALASIVLAAALIAGCPGGGGAVVSTPVTFRVTLRAIGAAELGTGADATVNGLTLGGTNLTVVR
jgi:hypothetical protein